MMFSVDSHHELQPAEQMQAMLAGHFVAQSLYAAAILGIPDLIEAGRTSVHDLAAATGCQGSSLYRLLRALASMGVFTELPNGRFGLTPLGATLRTDAPDSVRDKAIFETSEPIWAAWGGFLDTLRSGKPSFPRLYSTSIYGYLGAHPESGAVFNRFMTAQSSLHNTAIVEAYDFSGTGVFVDVGGGHGATLAAMLEAYPGITGLLFDLPEVVTPVTALETSRFGDRCAVVGGNMLHWVPTGGDVYIVKRVLMDKSDDEAVTVLRNCLAGMKTGGKVLVIDPMLPDGAEPHPNWVTDLLMLVLTGGRCRTVQEFSEVFRTAGLRLARIIPTHSPNFILEGVRPVIGLV